MSQASRSFSPQPARSCKAPTLQGGPADPATLLHDGSGSGCPPLRAAPSARGLPTPSWLSPGPTLVCWGCRGKLPQTERLNDRIYCLTVLEGRGPRAGCWQGGFLLRAEKRAFLPASADVLATWAYRCLPSPCFIFTWPSPCACLCPHSPFL